MSEKQAKKYTLYLIFGTFIFRALTASINGLGTGEAYYARGIANLDWSYFDQPPLFIWISWLSTELLGMSTFTVRLPALLLFCGTSWFLYLVSKRLFSAATGFYAVLVMNVSAVFTMSVAYWFQPDAPLMFFWLLCTWCIVQILFPKDGQEVKGKAAYKWWILVGITMGMTSLSKYHVVFLLGGVFFFLLTRKSLRHWIFHPGPYIALVINLLFMFPVLIWNYQNNWISFLWQFGRAGSGEEFSLHFDWFITSIGGQFLWLSPWIFIPLILQLPKSYKKGKEQNNYWFLFWTSVLPIVFFTVITLWSDLGFHFHWQAPGYMMLFIALGESINKAFVTGVRAKLTRNWLYASGIFMLLSIAMLSIHSETGFWKPYGPKWFTSLFGNDHDPTIEMYDYTSIKDRFEEMGIYEGDDYFVCTTRWWTSGKVDWGLGLKKGVLCFNMWPRNYAYYFNAKDFIGKNAVVLALPGEGVNHIRVFFDEFEQIDNVDIVRSGITEFSFDAYVGKNFHASDYVQPHIPVDRQLREPKEDFLYFESVD